MPFMTLAARWHRADQGGDAVVPLAILASRRVQMVLRNVIAVPLTAVATNGQRQILEGQRQSLRRHQQCLQDGVTEALPVNQSTEMS